MRELSGFNWHIRERQKQETLLPNEPTHCFFMQILSALHNSMFPFDLHLSLSLPPRTIFPTGALSTTRSPNAMQMQMQMQLQLQKLTLFQIKGFFTQFFIPFMRAFVTFVLHVLCFPEKKHNTITFLRLFLFFISFFCITKALSKICSFGMPKIKKK